MTAAEIEQDARGLPDHELAGLQEWRRERRRCGRRLHHPHHRSRAAGAACDIDISGARLLQRETDIFTAPLNLRPVEEFVLHLHPRFRRRGLWPGVPGSASEPDDGSEQPVNRPGWSSNLNANYQCADPGDRPLRTDHTAVNPRPPRIARDKRRISAWRTNPSFTILS